MAPLRVAFVITELYPGGAERCLVNLATRLDRSRFEPVVISLKPRPTSDRDELVAKLADHGVRTEFLDVSKPWQVPTALSRLRRLLERQSPHVVQSFLHHANVMASLAAPRSTPLFTGLRVAERNWLRCRVERLASRRASRVVCVSQSVADFAREWLGVPPAKQAVIPNGLDLARYAAVRPADLSALGVPPGRKTIVFVGRLHPQKGADWLVEQIPALAASLPEFDWLFVGDGILRSNLEKRVANFQLSDRVHFAGWQPNTAERVAACDLFVLPSRYEGMSNSLLEAMVLGKPCVAARVEGVSETLGPAAEPQSYPVGDAAAFRQAVMSLATKPVWSAELGAVNHRRATEHFSLDRMVSAYAELYERPQNR